MNKFIGYGILLLIYLGLSKSLSPSEFGISYISQKEGLSKLVTGIPVSVILTDIHSIGFIIKTYYHKYKVIHGQQAFEEVIVRTSRLYSDQIKPYLGMSVFRRFRDGTENYTPLPPGSIFIGDKSFGNWINHESGEKVWRFFRVYRQIPNYLGWIDYVPNFKTYNQIQISLQQNKPFLGLNEEFGINGSITKKKYSQYFERQKPNEIEVDKLLKNYLKENFIN